MDDLTRKEAIEILQDDVMCSRGWLNQLTGSSLEIARKRIEAHEMAIRSLETDEAYQLEYEKPTQMIDKSNFSQDQYKADTDCAYGCGYNQGFKDGIKSMSDKPLIKCNICKYYTKMEGCLNDRCERFKDTTHPYCYCYWGKEKGAD